MTTTSVLEEKPLENMAVRSENLPKYPLLPQEIFLFTPDTTDLIWTNVHRGKKYEALYDINFPKWLYNTCANYHDYENIHKIPL